MHQSINLMPSNAARKAALKKDDGLETTIGGEDRAFNLLGDNIDDSKLSDQFAPAARRKKADADSNATKPAGPAAANFTHDPPSEKTRAA